MSSRWLAAAALLLAAAAAAGAERTEVGPAVCHPDCTKHGNCGEDGFCRCPFGRMGEACEIDFLAPCRPFADPEGEVSCGTTMSKSCECYKRCAEYACFTDWRGDRRCHGPFVHVSNRGCYRREGVPPDEQYSRIPEPDEKDVRCFSGFGPEAREVDCSTVMVQGMDVSLPLSQCKDECNRKGYCFRWQDNPTMEPFCRCYRGYEGIACEAKTNRCYRQCSGRGKCIDQYCHCEPPYFSIGCTRSKVYPNTSLVNPADFKIYMYELPVQLAYDNAYSVGWHQHDPIYIAYQFFLEQFLTSPVRTENPWEASLFYVPSFAYSYSSNVGSPQEHMQLVLEHIQHAHPWWNRTEGKDHFLWLPGDLGACFVGGIVQQPIKVLHWGGHSTKDNHPPMGHLGHPEYGCLHPLRDVVTVPHWPPDAAWTFNTGNLTLDELIAGKNKLLFFSGGILENVKEYSGWSLQALSALVKEWNDPKIDYNGQGVGGEYEQRLRQSKFCFAPYGHGWGNRLLQAMLAGCVPIIVQEHVFSPYEDVLPYEDFSLRLTNDDLPYLRETLRGISDVQYRQLLRNVLRHYKAFSWAVDQGGRAFDYTIASLRRKHLNMKALYF